MDDYYREEIEALKKERVELRHKGSEIKSVIDALEQGGEAVPREMKRSLSRKVRRIEEIILRLRQIKAGNATEERKIIGHIGPLTMLHKPGDRAAFARDAAQLKRSRPS